MITQRQLRYDNAEIIRALEGGDSFVINAIRRPRGSSHSGAPKDVRADDRAKRVVRASDCDRRETLPVRHRRIHRSRSDAADFEGIADLIEVVAL